MKNSRRQFLMNSGVLGLSLSLPFNAFSSQKMASIAEDHFFVLIQVPDGMDATLGLNPLTHQGTDQKDIFLEYRQDEIIKSGNMLFGPAASSLAKHYKEVSVVNGIVMRRDVGHSSLLNYISSGNGDGSTGYVNVEFDRLAKKLPLGTLVNSDISTGISQPTLSQISSFISESSASQKSLDDLSFLNEFYKIESHLKGTQNNYLKFKKNEKNFTSSLESIVSKLGIERNEASVIASAFSSGSANSAVLNLNSVNGLSIDMDTHSNHEGRHLNNQSQAWSYVSDLFDVFKKIEYKKKSLFEHTTFMVVTEFSRTPFLNPAKGKDHNVFTNSMLLAGKGVNGNNTIGQSHVISREKRGEGQALHIGSPLDYKTGETVQSNNGTGLIFPENVVKSLHQVFNVDKNSFYPGLRSVKTLPGLGKNK